MFGFGSSSSTPEASSSSSSSSPSSSSTTTPAAPNREERAQCWTARDAYFTCLDKNGIIVAGSEDPKVTGPCQSEKKGYEGSCSRSWIEYFNKRRTLEMRQKATVDAAAKARDENVANRGR